MRICLIGASALDVAPYVEKYAILLDNMDVDYEIITKEYSKCQREHVFNEKIKIFYYGDAISPLDKIKRFYNYAKFVNMVIENGNYDKIVVFDAFYASLYYLVNGMKFYKNKSFIIDIRDYNALLDNIIVKNALKKVFKRAEFIVVSSAKFKEWLPCGKKIITMHNLPNTNKLLENNNIFKRKYIKIAYLGGIGYYLENQKIVDTFYNTDNIKVFYAGKYPDTENIRDYCDSKGYTNIEFQGEYNNNEKFKLYEDVDIINAVYGNDSLVVTTALPNKLYDCIIYGIPIMVSSGTYLSEIVNKYKLGFDVDVNCNNLMEMLHKYYTEFDENEFTNGRKECLKYIVSEQHETENMVKQFVEICADD